MCNKIYDNDYLSVAHRNHVMMDIVFVFDENINKYKTSLV